MVRPLSLISWTVPSCVCTKAVNFWVSEARTNTVPLAVAVRSSTDPCVMNRPRPITMIWSALTAISLIRCELTKTVRPSLARDRKNSRIHLIPSGSSPLTGSSKSRTPGSPSRAPAMPRRWLIPRENPPTFLFATELIPANSRTSSTRDFFIWFDAARARKWFRAVRPG